MSLNNNFTNQKSGISFIEFSKNINTWIDRVPKKTNIKAIEVKYKKHLEALNQNRECVRCGVVYRPASNFIYRGCKTHITKYSMLYRPPMYPCCRRFQNSQGCTHSMHVSTKQSEEEMFKNPYDHVVLIPKILVDNGLIDIAREYIHKDLVEKYPEYYPLKTINIQ